MSKKANKTAIGLFVVGAVVLLMTAIVVFGSGLFFRQTSKYVLFFDDSVKGLSVGAPVMFRGVRLGTVKDISLMYDPETRTVMLPVVVEIEPDRIKGAPSLAGAVGAKKMIELGLRAKLEVQNFLTSQLMIAFDFYPEKPAKLLGVVKGYPELPTIPISPDIFALMEDLPLKDISNTLNEAVKGVIKLVNSNDLPKSLYEMRTTLDEVKQASRSFRLLVEYLEQHPEAILKGKPATKGE
jgi:paraquat-inducible protein B